MNLRRIVLFSLALVFAQTLTASTVTYFVSSKFGGDHEQFALWAVSINGVVDFAVIVPLFYWLGRHQRFRPYLHAAISLVLSEAAGLAVLSFFLGYFAIHLSHAIGILTLSVYAALGTTMGLRRNPGPALET
jgi:Na+/melibiose symporter-like transporter